MMMEAVQEMSQREVFSIYVREHHREMLIYARSLTRKEESARDIVQESFVAAWKTMGTFDVTRDFGCWMRGIVRNKWREWLRREKRQVPLGDEILEVMEAEMRAWDQARQDGGPSVFLRLEECLRRLPQAMTEVVKKVYYEGNRTAEAADLLGVQGATVRKRLERARSVLRDCISARK